MEIACPRYAEETGFPDIPTWQAPPRDPRYPLLLVTPKSPHRTHSQGSGVAEIQRGSAHALELNPQDARARGIDSGERVRLFNAQGVVHVAARLSDDLSPGVVCMPEGVWFEPDREGHDVGGSANMVTSTQGTAPGVSCIMHGVGVEVEREAGC